MKIARAMAEKAEKLLQIWGASVTIRQGESSRQILALIQPLRNRSRQYQETAAAFAGLIDRGFFQMYLSGKESLPSPGDIVETSNRRYLVLQGESMEAQGEVVYRWVLLAGASQETQR